MTKLTIKAAKEYVSGYYESLEDCTRFEIEGAGLFTLDGLPICRVNVVGEHFGPFAVQWDVFEEDDGEGRTCLRGEF